MLQRLSIATGAGFAAALLFAVLTKGTFLAGALNLLAPLPIVIATLGWGLDVGAMSVAIAGLVIAVLMNPLAGVIFVATTSLPAWLLSSAALLPQPRLFSRAPNAERKDWFSAGGLVALAALTGALLGLATLAAVIAMYGGYQKGVEALTAEMLPGLKDLFESMMALPSGVTFEELVANLVRLFPAFSAMLTCLVFCANLYFGARAVQLSHRLSRPWPNLPESLILPPYLGLVLVACAGLGLLLRAPAATVAWIGVGALGCAYALQGLAVVHALSRGLPVRIPALVAFYVGCIATAGWALPALTLIGLIESLFSLRARRAAAANAKS